MLKKLEKTFKRFVKFARKPIGIVTLVVVAVILGIILSSIGKSDVTYDTTIAEKKDIVQKVSVTGRVEPTQEVDLAPEKGGKVTRIDVEIKERVKEGKILLSTNNSNLQAQLAEANANLEIEKIELRETGKTSETDLANARENLIDKITDAYTKTDDAIRNNTDQLFTGTPPSYDTSIYRIDDIKKHISVNTKRIQIVYIFEDWNDINLSINDETDIGEVTDAVEGYLEFVQLFLNDLGDAVNGFPNNTSLNTYKALVGTARANVNTALTNFRSAKQNYLSVKANVTNSGNQFEDILKQEERVKNAQAKVNSILAQIEQTIVRAPFDGVVTKIDAELGEIIPSNVDVVSVISDNEFQIETFVPEADIADISIGDLAEITLDAYSSSDIFHAKVISIDPAETVIEGVATYKVVLQFDKQDERIKPGMTANTDIITGEMKNVISVPQRAVIEKDGKKIVRILEGKDIEEVEVETGLRGFEGDIEIKSGISEGDEVVVFVRE